MVAARALTVLLYGGSLALLYLLVWQRRPRRAGGILLPSLAMVLMTANPFCYAFDRMAILEPVMVFWLMLGLWLAGRTQQRDLGRSIGIGVLLSLLVHDQKHRIISRPGRALPSRGHSGPEA